MATALVALPASAEIFKCTDRAGNVTYQNEKCPAGTSSSRVEVFDNSWTASRAEQEAEWQRAAAERRVATGMPARWVREALGEPAEIRQTTTGGATELWAYSLPDRTVQVGMLDSRVLWFRETPLSAPTVRPAPSQQSAPAAAAAQPAEAPRGAGSPRTTEVPRAAEPPGAAEARPPDPPRTANAPRVADASRGPARGRNCKEFLAELGPPDRQREIPPSDANGTDAATEYVYESGTSAGAGRTRVLCANGKVEGVDRSVAR